MVREVMRELRRRKPDIASLVYFDAALADRHAKRVQTPSERAAIVINFDGLSRCMRAAGTGRSTPGPNPDCSAVARRASCWRSTGLTR
jgi:hypothetical protein